MSLPKNSTLTGVYEFFILARKNREEDSPERILQVFQDHRAKLISVSSYPLGEPTQREFVVSCVMDVSKIDCQIDDLLILIRKLRFVTRAEKSKMNGRGLSNFLFPPMVSNGTRAVILDAETLLALEYSTALVCRR